MMKYSAFVHLCDFLSFPMKSASLSSQQKAVIQRRIIEKVSPSDCLSEKNYWCSSQVSSDGASFRKCFRMSLSLNLSIFI